MDADVKDTIAYKISRQIMDHVYGSDEEMSDDDFVFVYRVFMARGGSWEGLMGGDMHSVDVIEKVLEDFVKNRRTLKIATRLASGPSKVPVWLT